MFTSIFFTMTWIVTYHGAVVSKGTPEFRTEYQCQEARARMPAYLPNGDAISTTPCVQRETTK